MLALNTSTYLDQRIDTFSTKVSCNMTPPKKRLRREPDFLQHFAAEFSSFPTRIWDANSLLKHGSQILNVQNRRLRFEVAFDLGPKVPIGFFNNFF